MGGVLHGSAAFLTELMGFDCDWWLDGDRGGGGGGFLLLSFKLFLLLLVSLVPAL